MTDSRHTHTPAYDIKCPICSELAHHLALYGSVTYTAAGAIIPLDAVKITDRATIVENRSYHSLPKVLIGKASEPEKYS